MIIKEERTYDTFGNLISRTGENTSPIGFHSKYYDKEAGFYYFYHRYYNPGTGRFTTEDPIGIEGGLNLYKAFGNNPINYRDPWGLVVICKKVNNWETIKKCYKGIKKKEKIWKQVESRNLIPAISLSGRTMKIICACVYAYYGEKETEVIKDIKKRALFMCYDTKTSETWNEYRYKSEKTIITRYIPYISRHLILKQKKGWYTIGGCLCE